MERLGAPNQIVNQLNFVQVNPAGTQSAKSFAQFDTMQLRQVLAQVGPVTPYRMVVEGLTMEFTMTNFTNTPVEIDIYDIACLRDAYQNFGFINNGTSYTPQPIPEQYWSAGLDAQRQLTWPSTSYNVVGCSPTDSQLFKDWFRITKRVTVLLPIAGAHRHVVTVKTNRLIDTLLAGNTAGTTNLAGYTNYTMIVQKGLPVYNATEGAFNCTTSSNEVGIVAVQRIKYTYVQDISFTSVLNASLPLPAAAQQTSWNQGSGVINSTQGLSLIT